MKNIVKILIIDNHQNGKFIQPQELEKIIGNSCIVVKENIQSALSELKDNQYDTVVFNNNYSVKEKGDLLKTLNNFNPNTHVVIVRDKVENPETTQPSSTDTISYICQNTRFEETVALITINAIKTQKLISENQQLRDKLDNLNNNGKVADLILSYNHEINNPLTTILGNTQLLLKRCNSGTNSQVVEKLKRIEDSVHRIQHVSLNLTNNIVLNPSG